MFSNYSDEQERPTVENNTTSLHLSRSLRVPRRNQHTHANVHIENHSSIVIPVGFSPYGGFCTVHAHGSHWEPRIFRYTGHYQTENRTITWALPSVFSISYQLKLSKEVTFVGRTRQDSLPGNRIFLYRDAKKGNSYRTLDRWIEQAKQSINDVLPSNPSLDCNCHNTPFRKSVARTFMKALQPRGSLLW